MSETNTLKRIMLGHNSRGRLFRNNQGIASYNNIKVRYGVARGGSDLIGFTIIGGKAIFTAIEVKDEKWTFDPNDKREVQQLNFINLVDDAGGIAGFVRSVGEYEKIIKDFIDKCRTNAL